MKLLLVRHGRTIANIMGALDTAFPGNSLDATGLTQAASLPNRLDTDQLAEISSLWTSPIARARQTIAPLEGATGLTADIDSGLREVLAGDLEMCTDARSVACYTDTTRAWMIGRTAARLTGRPADGADTCARFAAAGARSARAPAADVGADGTALLVAHGTVLRLWTALAAAPGGGADPAWIADHPMRNTGISVVEGDPECGWSLVDWNEGEWSAPTAPDRADVAA